MILIAVSVVSSRLWMWCSSHWASQLSHLWLGARAPERPLASHIQVFDNHRHRFPFRTNCKGNSTWVYCVLAFRFLSEYVAIIMLHRERQFAGALDNR